MDKFGPYRPYLGLFFKSGYRIIQTGNGIISPTFRPLIRKLLLKHLLHINKGVRILFSKWEMEIFKQEMELFLTLPGLWSNNFFYNIISILTKEFEIYFQNRKCTGNRIISPTFRPLIKKLLLHNVSHLVQGLQNWFSKQEMELSKQEMELFIPFPGLWSKIFFYQKFFIYTKEFKIDL